MASASESASVPVLCVGLGAMGRLTARRICGHPRLRITGGVDIDPDLVGLPLADVVDDPRAGTVAVVDTAPASPGPEGVAILLTTSRLAAVHPQVLALVRGGWNVVSTCEELAYPEAGGGAAAASAMREVDAEARAGGVTVLGTGVNPGFLMDALPLVLALASTDIRRIEVRRVVDVLHRRMPLQRKVGVGRSVEEFREGAGSVLGHVGLVQSARLIAAGLDVAVLEAEETLEPVLSEETLATHLGRLQPGQVAGQHQRVRLRCGGGLEIRLDLVMAAGAEPEDAVTIEGEPAVRYRAAGGVSGDDGTAAVVTNMVAPVAAAPPGLRTLLDFLPTRRPAV